ncbi:DUF624 domain-containing protein [Bacillus sp. FJAT-50079]|uniref:YesL family protein n=1 Tax=Bacillus sp. FJAT-50079 TaxID=2833577 RepID=UPI001BC9A7A0|nr:DUF624 domain-containing protein [Bacillus sp. FJAT-50079]MBS4206881.1 DUF624 domain-containing protein [Bacillus sp. FJAT-50079]
MGIVDSKIYRSLEFIMNFFVLNLLWLLACLPIITIFPATTAMFGVIRDWKSHYDTPIFTTYFRMFKENFKLSFLIGCLWIVFAILLVADFMFTNQLDSIAKYPLFAFFFLLGILYVFVTIYIFPVIVHYNVTFNNAIKAALLLSISHLPFTLLSMLIFGAAIAINFYFPAAMFISFSVAVYLVYSLIERAFRKVEQKGTIEVNNG